MEDIRSIATFEIDEEDGVWLAKLLHRKIVNGVEEDKDDAKEVLRIGFGSEEDLSEFMSWITPIAITAKNVDEIVEAIDGFVESMGGVE